MFLRGSMLVVAITGLLGSVLPAADATADREQLRLHLGGDDVDRLIKFLNSQVPTDNIKGEVQKWIEQLGDRKFSLRQEASRRLISVGPPALPALREAMSHPDREVAARAKRCIVEIESGPRSDLPLVAVRHLARSRDERTVQALLDYYPTTPDGELRAEVLRGLVSAGIAGNQVSPALVKALGDREPNRRAAAVQALLHSTDKSLRPQLREKLKDSDPGVRFHAAVGLFHTGERDTVPVLIDLIKHDPNAAHWQLAEELLYTLAGELAPHPEVGDASAANRAGMASQWAEWWKARGEQVLFGQKDDRPNDVAVVTEAQGRVFEWRPDAPPRFDIKNLPCAMDARVLNGNRVLVAEENVNKVVELDFRGKVIWEKTFDEGPVSVQRLANGNTFVALYTRVVEVRRDGQIALSITIPGNDDGTSRISDANKLPDGRIACLCTSGELLYMTPSGKRISSVSMGGYGGVDALPNGNVLVSFIGGGKVQEVNPAGKVVWKCELPKGWVGTRLPDGHTLIATRAERKMCKVDASGKVVWEKSIDGTPHAMHWK